MFKSILRTFEDEILEIFKSIHAQQKKSVLQLQIVEPYNGSVHKFMRNRLFQYWVWIYRVLLQIPKSRPLVVSLLYLFQSIASRNLLRFKKGAHDKDYRLKESSSFLSLHAKNARWKR